VALALTLLLLPLLLSEDPSSVAGPDTQPYLALACS
jgi:hypothetical protein